MSERVPDLNAEVKAELESDRTEYHKVKTIIPWPSQKLVYIELIGRPDDDNRFKIDCTEAFWETLYSAALAALGSGLKVKIRYITPSFPGTRTVLYMYVKE
jgi:hypothetical protein